METLYYRVLRIEGEYAILEEKKNKEEMFIAMALLPSEVDVGSFLKYEMFSYEIVSEDVWISAI
ncbi:MAG: chorismate--pyruvate lyase [Ruminococcaceae bacterium]|nr:chorismate--pyruvate lyase [Oscillospiraceae bacterium]